MTSNHDANSFGAYKVREWLPFSEYKDEVSVTKFAEGKMVAEIQSMVTTYLPSPVFDEKTGKSNLVDYFVASVMAQRTAGHKNLDVSRDARDSPS